PGPRDAAGVAAARADVDAKLAKIRAFAADNPSRVGIALSADDVERLAGQGKTAVLIGFQNARSLGDDAGQIDALYRDGVRVFAFNHAGHNSWS
ncbi:membrane dipeptidase, partial [Brevundimonas sp.]|uniref:membrane dipeptidase n=1 Tax=Brevundimonas sp. TaxID=1871086 RepID=UPI0028A61A7E